MLLNNVFFFPFSLFLKACFLFVTYSHLLFPRNLPIHYLLACSFLYLFITYLPTHLPICSLFAYLYACLFIPCLAICLLPHCPLASLVIHRLLASPTCIACLCHIIIYVSPVQVPIILGSSPPSIWYYPLIYLCKFLSKEQGSQ
jgi:hypothetical protein